MLDLVNRRLDEVDRGGAIARYDSQSQQAFALLSSSRARTAFDLAQEPAAVRDRYGRHKFAQSVLLARRSGRSGRVAGAGQLAARARRHGFGQPGLGHPLPQQPTLAYRPDAAHGSGLLGTAGRPERAGAARRDSGGVDGGVRPHARINQGGGRDHWGQVFSWRWPGRAFAAAWCMGPPTPSAPSARRSCPAPRPGGHHLPLSRPAAGRRDYRSRRPPCDDLPRPDHPAIILDDGADAACGVASDDATPQAACGPKPR